MNILVILERHHQHDGADSLLLRKAALFAEKEGATLELFRVVHDRAADVSMFLTREGSGAARSEIMDREEAWVAPLATSLNKKGLKVDYEIRWDHPRADAIVRKVEDGNVDWVLKEVQDDRSVLGLFSNSDWEVLRDCPVPVYFVKGANPPGAGVLVALEGFADEETSSAAALDYDVYRQGRRIAEAFDTPMTLVHAYQLPSSLPAFVGYSPLITDGAVAPEIYATLTEAERTERQAVAERHGRAIHAFADYFGYPVADIVIKQGPPQDVISREAHDRQVGLVVMGAGEANMIDRLFHNVTAEPTLAEACCDILFVKPESLRAKRRHRERPHRDIPKRRKERSDREQLKAILSGPSKHFTDPGDVIEAACLTPYTKRRILRAWERDLRKRENSLADDAHNKHSATESEVLKTVRQAMRALRHS